MAAAGVRPQDLRFSDDDAESSGKAGEPTAAPSGPSRLARSSALRLGKSFWRSMACRVGLPAAMHAEPKMTVGASADPVVDPLLPVARPAASSVVEAEPVSPGSRIPLPPSLLPVMPLTRSGNSKAM
jgi:hypothetical protein